MNEEGPSPLLLQENLRRERVSPSTCGQSGPCPTRGQSSHAQTSTLPAWCGQEKEEGCQKSLEEAAWRSTERHLTLLLCVVQKQILLVEKPGIVGSVLKALYLLGPSCMLTLAMKKQAPRSPLYLWVPCISLPRNSRPPKATEGGIK